MRRREGWRIGGSGQPVDVERAWLEFYGLICTGLGVTPGEVDGMRYADALNLVTYWRDYPPTHLLVRGALGFKSAQPAAAPTPEELEALVAAYGKAG